MKKRKIHFIAHHFDAASIGSFGADSPGLVEFKEALNHPNLAELSFDIDCDDYYGEVKVQVRHWRWETGEEAEERKLKAKKRSEAAKRGADTRSKQREERERALFEKLKKKYDGTAQIIEEEE